MSKTKLMIDEVEKWSAHNYHPIPIVIAEGEGIWVTDVEGNKYMDMLAAYSAVNQGHRHPKIVSALIDQAQKMPLTSRAFHNDKMGAYVKKLCEFTGFEKVLPMNTGAEAVETALKAVRKWGHQVKGVECAEIIACQNNFAGRTISTISFSTEDQYREGFGPFTPGFKTVPFGDLKALEDAITDNTVAVIMEPIQGEAGIIVPPEGYLKGVREITKANNVLMVCDEIQTGFGRTGKLFAFEHDNIRPDVVTVGKALSGGLYPVSAMLSSKEVMDVFRPGDHGSTFGGNPLGCAVAMAALDVLEDENLVERSKELGDYLLDELKKIDSEHIKEVRGKGLFVGVELDKPARPFCEALMKEGILCKETHEFTIRLAPPLVVKKEELDICIEKLKKVLK
ncbi:MULTISPECIES: ornithine--oxo-acid transaminase [Psychrilyobacter]|uniref:ornithine aminotransferase n=1 Tax=Psychrilyobacter piezotolerans TaxID=2293438 RepID=A0ABX9KLE0_9FUSO|nr:MULTISPECIES: ornithine--oxo-acid transaminase [Psychrilyobacter]MCS5420373.1 ornithine--oxo-acid transaminase [Psychrilyobacter sp. S5]NDI76376.1 ornithine--oxo-acid transaminase [Psychrilyobacter piezotolerans]RDE65974.1 ornithine--oxo-acid transaminase [Psychrilyobacter sp. S5]REI43152.1 ornithine--oxo-acid transaminase [Psychrilyobacter piezotolerans]